MEKEILQLLVLLFMHPDITTATPGRAVHHAGIRWVLDRFLSLTSTSNMQNTGVMHTGKENDQFRSGIRHHTC